MNNILRVSIRWWRYHHGNCDISNQKLRKIPVHSNYVVKTDFFYKSSRTLILSTCYSSIQSYFKIDLDLTMLFNVYFLYRKSGTIGPLTKNCPKLDKNKSTVFRFSLFVVYKWAVTAIQKSSYVGCFNFRQRMLVFAHLFLDISTKLIKLHFQSWKTFYPMISLFFVK